MKQAERLIPRIVSMIHDWKQAILSMTNSHYEMLKSVYLTFKGVASEFHIDWNLIYYASAFLSICSRCIL